MRKIFLLLMVGWLLAICVADDPARTKHAYQSGVGSYAPLLPHSLWHGPGWPTVKQSKKFNKIKWI